MRIVTPLLGLAVTLLSQGASAQPEASTSGQPDWLSQAKIVAQLEGVTVGEAVRRANLIKRAQKQAERWVNDPDFAGGWIDRRNGGFKIVHAFRGSSQRNIEDSELAANSTFAKVRYSLGELKSEINRVGKILNAAGIDSVFSVDLEHNRVTLQVEDPSKVQALRDTGQLSLADFVFVVKGETKRRPEVAVDGAGETYGEFRDSAGYLTANPCTAGFTVISTAAISSQWAGNLPQGTKGISTAGHCNETAGLTQTHRTLNIGTLVETRNQVGGLDVAWFRNSANTYNNRVRLSSTSYYSITSVPSIDTLYTSTPICLIRRDSTQQCAYFKRLSAYAGGSDGPYVQVDRDISAGGDSGGPWLYGGQAYGIHSGDSPPDAAGLRYSEYTPADSLPRMNIKVLTTP